ncbi:multidrug efflux SMR transporter [Candidatus Chloroploca sp. Khr17]|uniref:DMT family transporter n=1 Tax=Candidatus Chloroploca sp. Khr17 TaxID=2496869 RepID=UPI00101C7122|nr:EamA family transporter [Candidatus Chloroploca sp. Khr17]
MQKLDEATFAMAHTNEAVAEPRRIGGLTVSTWILILVATVMGIVGQTMLKHGMTQMGALTVSYETVPNIVWQIIRSPFVVGGLMIYGFGTFFWLITLSRIDLSVAYPLVSLNHVLLFFIGWLILREHVTPMRAMGVAVICLGMILVARS